MGKIDIEFRSKRSQRTAGCIEQGICGAIIRRSEPFALEDSPERLGDIQMRAVRREEKEIQSTFLPYRTEFPHELASMDACIVKDNKSVFTDSERKSVNKIGNLVGGHVLSCGESFIPIVAVNHAENVESQTSFRWDIDILTAELPSVWHISFGADVAFISIINVDETVFFLLYEFLQLLGLIRIELRRGFPLRTFPYTSISRAKADKKALKVLSEASFPEACCHASFAFFTLCLSFSMALRTASSSEQSIIGFRPRPGRVSSPLIPSVSKRFTQELTDIWVISVCSPTCSEVRPVDFRSTARQRMRYAWLLPLRKPSSSCRRCWSVSCITLIFAIAVCLYVFTQRYAKNLI